MSVTRVTTTPTNAAAASSRRGRLSTDHATGAAPSRFTATHPSTAVRDADRGAKAGPDDNHSSTGAAAAGAGAGELRSARGANAGEGYPTTPQEAAANSYAAANTGGGTGSTYYPGSGAWSGDRQRQFEKLLLNPSDIQILAESNLGDAQLDAIAAELARVEPIGSTPTAGVDAGSATSASAQDMQNDVPARSDSDAMASEWEAKVREVTSDTSLTPEQVDAKLRAAYTQITGEAPPVEAGASTGAAIETETDPAPEEKSAWTSAWEKKFRDLLERQLVPASEIDSQIADASSAVMSDDALKSAYDDMRKTLGDFDERWKSKFEKLFTKIKAPEDDQQLKLRELASSNLSTADLQKQYDTISASLPAWDDSWDSKFRALELPDDLLKQAKESGGNAEQLQASYDSLLGSKMKYYDDGRLKKMIDAGADKDERWGVMLNKVEGKDFDKFIEGEKSSHVAGWKRVASIATNFIPGAFAVQFVVGHDLWTGEKIDRTNPLNILGAVASGFSAVSLARAGVTAIRATSTLARTAAAAEAGGTALPTAMREAGEAAGILNRIDHSVDGYKALTAWDKVKTGLPIINRFGEARKLGTAAKSYDQWIRGAATDLSQAGAAIKGTSNSPRNIKSSIIKDLRSGEKTLTEAAQGKNIANVDDITAAWENTTVYKGATSAGQAGTVQFNPFKRDADIMVRFEENGRRSVELGKNATLGNKAGLAKLIGGTKGAELDAITSEIETLKAASKVNEGLKQTVKVVKEGKALTLRTEQLIANRADEMAALAKRVGVDANNSMIHSATSLATVDASRNLGVTGGGPLRTLSQVTKSGQDLARLDRSARFGQNGLYNAASAAARMPGNSKMIVPFFVSGAMVGMPGKQFQGYWDYLKIRDEVHAEEKAAREQADAELARLEEINAQNQPAGTVPATAGAPVTGPVTAESVPATTEAAPVPSAATPTAAAPTGPTVVGTSATGGQIIYDPASDIIYDAQNGDVYDRNTGAIIGNLNQQQAQAQVQPQTQAVTTQPATTQQQYQATAADLLGTQGQPTMNAAPQTVAAQPAATNTGVTIDPTTGYYIDQTTGLMADPATGNVIDPKTNQIIGNLNQQPTSA